MQVLVKGTGFPTGITTGISLLIDGIQQTIQAVESDTSIVFNLSTLLYQTSVKIILNFADGLPTGFNSLLPLNFVPKFRAITPNVGESMGGTLITVTASGVV
jgi:hypothetical protein